MGRYIEMEMDGEGHQNHNLEGHSDGSPCLCCRWYQPVIITTDKYQLQQRK